MTLFIGGPADGKDMNFRGNPYVEVPVPSKVPPIIFDESDEIPMESSSVRKHRYARQDVLVSFYASEDTGARMAMHHDASQLRSNGIIRRVIFHEAVALAAEWCGLDPDVPPEILADAMEEKSRGDKCAEVLAKIMRRPGGLLGAS